MSGPKIELRASSNMVDLRKHNPRQRTPCTPPPCFPGPNSLRPPPRPVFECLRGWFCGIPGESADAVRLVGFHERLDNRAALNASCADYSNEGRRLSLGNCHSRKALYGMGCVSVFSLLPAFKWTASGQVGLSFSQSNTVLRAYTT
jgi:hypothetical protein